MKELIGLKMKKSDGLSSTIYVGELASETSEEITLFSPMRLVEFALPMQQPMLDKDGKQIYQSTIAKDEKGRDVQIPGKPIVKNSVYFDSIITDELFCGIGTTVRIVLDDVSMLVEVSEKNTPALFKKYMEFLSISKQVIKQAFKKPVKQHQSMKDNLRQLQR